MNKFNSPKNNKKIIDSFSFFNEFDLLKLRLNYLNDVVDYFLICECNHTYSAIPKPYYLDEVIDDIPENIRKKIIRIKYEVDGRYYYNDHWRLEKEQRDFIGKNLASFSPDDIIMVSDLDEIPNKNSIEKILNMWDNNSLYALKCDWFLYNFNTCLPNSWWGTCFSSIQKCIENGSQWMRDNGSIIFNMGMESNIFNIIENGGWHFSYFYDVEKIKTKIESGAHHEFNKQEYKNFIYLNDCIKNKKSFYYENMYFFDYNFNDFQEELKKLIIDIFPENYYKNETVQDLSKMKWETDLVKDIRTFTEIDDMDGNVMPHPLGYSHYFDDNGNIIYPVEVTHCNRYHLLEQFNKVRDNCKAILEIGIGRNADESFAYVFFKNKKKDTVYVGVDTDDRSFMIDVENNIHTIQNSSSNYDENVEIFKTIGVDKFDFIFIDGWHSINQVLLDWEYTNLLADGGIVGFHDTSCHPGPNNFVRALDKNKWDVIENCCPEDWGIGFARKK